MPGNLRGGDTQQRGDVGSDVLEARAVVDRTWCYRGGRELPGLREAAGHKGLHDFLGTACMPVPLATVTGWMAFSYGGTAAVSVGVGGAEGRCRFRGRRGGSGGRIGQVNILAEGGEQLGTGGFGNLQAVGV